VNVNDLPGVGYLITGKALYQVSAPGFRKGRPAGHGTISQGIAILLRAREVGKPPSPAANRLDGEKGAPRP
jgi:hypothetical protein